MQRYLRSGFGWSSCDSHLRLSLCLNLIICLTFLTKFFLYPRAKLRLQLINEGSSKFASIPSGGGGGGGGAVAAVGGTAAAAAGGDAEEAEAKAPAKEEEKEESDDDMVSSKAIRWRTHHLLKAALFGQQLMIDQGFGLFD